MNTTGSHRHSALIIRGIGTGVAGLLLSVAAIGPSAAFASAPASSTSTRDAAGRSPASQSASAQRKVHVTAHARATKKKHHKKRNRRKAKPKVQHVSVAHTAPVAAPVVKSAPRSGSSATASTARPAATPPPTLASLAAFGTLTNVVNSNYALQQTMLTGLRAQRSDTRLRSGFSLLTGQVQSALTTLPFLATSGAVRTNTGPALMAASASVVNGSSVDRANAIATFDTLLNAQRRTDGSITSQSTSGDIDTMFFTANLGTADLLLHSQLDAAHQASWDSAVAGAADFLINNGNLRWYTNGNITIGNALVEALAYRITGQERFLTAYNTAWEFATAPNQARWPGMGFQITQQPTAADGSDGRGYFTEEGRFLGYDPDYSQMQSELLSRLFALTRDPRVLTKLNMLVNQLLQRVNTTGMLLDASGGSRHDYPTPYAFDSSAVSVLAYLGGRQDLVPYTYAQGVAITKEFTVALNQKNLSDRAMWAVGAITGTIAWIANPVGAASSFTNFTYGY